MWNTRVVTINEAWNLHRKVDRLEAVLLRIRSSAIDINEKSVELTDFFTPWQCLCPGGHLTIKGACAVGAQIKTLSLWIIQEVDGALAILPSFKIPYTPAYPKPPPTPPPRLEEC